MLIVSYATLALLSSITRGVLFVKMPFVWFHSKIPYNESAVSAQYVPSATAPAGVLDAADNCDKSIGARTTYAAELTPNNE